MLLPNAETIIRNLAKSWKSEHIELICLDIERWHVNGTEDERKNSIIYFKKIIKWIRQESPITKIGLYGVLPIREVYDSLQDPNSHSYLDWQSKNNNLISLAKLVDVIFPSLYTLTTDPEAWKKFAISNITQAKLYGKPVYPFLWPRFHDSMPNLSETYIPSSYWELELLTVKEHADGFVIWDNFDKGSSVIQTSVWNSVISIIKP